MSTPVTLTPDQIAVIRLDIGDGCDKLSDEQVQIAYNSAEGDSCGTNAILSRWLWMMAKTSTLNLANGAQGVSSKAVDIYKERLDYWEACAGKPGGTISAGMIDLDIDSTRANLIPDLLHQIQEWSGGGL